MSIHVAHARKHAVFVRNNAHDGGKILTRTHYFEIIYKKFITGNRAKIATCICGFAVNKRLAFCLIGNILPTSPFRYNCPSLLPLW